MLEWTSDQNLLSFMGGKVGKVLKEIRIVEEGKISPEEARVIWDTFDKDKNGVLDGSEISEFVKAWMQANDLSTDAASVTEVQDQFMNTFDVDKSGSISWEELTGAKLD